MTVVSILCCFYCTSFAQCSEVQFFGATTLHSKLIRHWAEVPKEHYEELRQKLMNAIILFGSGPRIVLNRLCISVSNLFLFFLFHVVGLDHN